MMDHLDITVLSETTHPRFIERKEKWVNKGLSDKPIEMHNGYALDGSYIGDMRTTNYLCIERAIKPERRTPTSKVASVGFCSPEGKWYGWSHRAISSFPTREEAAVFAESVS